MNLKKLMNFNFDKGWKLLIYFDFLLPALLFLLAWLTNAPFIAKIFHSYEMFIVNPIPDFKALTGIIGLVYHIGIIGYTVKKRNYIDMTISVIMTLLITAFFIFEINYLIIRPLNFASF